MKNSTTVSGQLRIRVTYIVPNPRSGATGDTRVAAITVPISRAPTMAQRQMPSERRKASPNNPQLSVIAFTEGSSNAAQALAQGERQKHGPMGRPPRHRADSGDGAGRREQQDQ